MDLIVDIVLAIALWFAGLFIGSFFVINILCCIFCSIPITRQISKVCKVQKGKIYCAIGRTIFLCSFITAGITTLVWLFAPAIPLAVYLAELLFSVILGIGQVGQNRANVSDYFSAYGKYIDMDGIDQFFDENGPMK